MINVLPAYTHAPSEKMEIKSTREWPRRVVSSTCQNGFTRVTKWEHLFGWRRDDLPFGRWGDMHTCWEGLENIFL